MGNSNIAVKPAAKQRNKDTDALERIAKKRLLSKKDKKELREIFAKYPRQERRRLKKYFKKERKRCKRSHNPAFYMVDWPFYIGIVSILMMTYGLMAFRNSQLKHKFILIPPSDPHAAWSLLLGILLFTFAVWSFRLVEKWRNNNGYPK